jgi:hypothetical protein
MEQEIGDIGNYYGGLSVKKEDDKFYWSIENCGGERNWYGIPEYLYITLVHYENERNTNESVQSFR